MSATPSTYRAGASDAFAASRDATPAPTPRVDYTAPQPAPAKAEPPKPMGPFSAAWDAVKTRYPQIGNAANAGAALLKGHGAAATAFAGGMSPAQLMARRHLPEGVAAPVSDFLGRVGAMDAATFGQTVQGVFPGMTGDTGAMGLLGLRAATNPQFAYNLARMFRPAPKR